MARYLSERGLGEWEIVSAERHDPVTGEWPTHAWLQEDSVIVDVTADQLPGEGRPPVWVSEDDDWYRGWEASPSRLAPYGDDDGPDRQAYEAMVRHSSERLLSFRA
ncbi:hypothetical protein OG592_37195 [Streptomyces avidinii]|uniref:hypothetical protein n=1 Tax=Streptomyces avidinii TaxID=1895 RepID=UPI00386FA905|nr:hypothetical protein OG592_37195 [Streptomyces avidinii]